MTRKNPQPTSEKMRDWHNQFEMRRILNAYMTRHKRAQSVLDVQQTRARQLLADRIRVARQAAV